MASCGTAHNAYPVRIQASGCRFAADHSDCPLEVFPGYGMLRKAAFRQRARSAVFECDHSHSLRVQVPSCRSDFEAVRAVACVVAARVDYLDSLGCQMFGDMPFYVRMALPFLQIGHLPFRPYVFLNELRPVLVAGILLHDRHFRLQLGDPSHLAHEFHRPVEAKGRMSPVSVQVQFRRYSHPTQLPVNQGRSHRGIGVTSSVVKAHGAGLPVKAEQLAEGNVRSVTFTNSLRAEFPVSSPVSRRVDYSPVDVAWDGVKFVHRGISFCLGTGRQKQGEMGSSRHRDGTNLFRVETAPLRLASHKPYGSLPILPCCLIKGYAFGTRSPVDKIDALEAEFRQFFRPFLDIPHIAAAVVRSPGDQHHTGSVARLWRLEPFDIGHAVFVRPESFCGRFIRHRCNLMRLSIRHFALRPNQLPLCCKRAHAAEESLLGIEKRASRQCRH